MASALLLASTMTLQQTKSEEIYTYRVRLQSMRLEVGIKSSGVRRVAFVIIFQMKFKF